LKAKVCVGRFSEIKEIEGNKEKKDKRIKKGGEFFLHRRAQVSQVFTYLITILVIGVIVVVGYKGIAWIMKTNCEHGRLSFEKSLLEFIDEYSDLGVHQESLSVPCNVREVCFADSRFCSEDITERPPPIATYETKGADRVIISTVEDCTASTANIFIKGENTEPIGFAGKLVLNEQDFPFKCFPAKSGKFKFLFRGLGRKTQVEAG